MPTMETMRLSEPQPRPTAGLAPRVAAAVLLSLAIATLLLAVPELRGVGTRITHMRLGWIGMAAALELASCFSFVAIFRMFFDGLPAGTARELAWAEEGSGALLPGGGVGALAIGGWLLRRAGVSTRSIVDRSSALFFLTSAVNVAALIGAGVWFAAARGSFDLVRAGLPIAGGLTATLAVLVIPRAVARSPRRAWPSWLIDLAAGITRALGSVRRPSWRLLGALGYLGFDIAALGATLAAAGRPVAAAPLVLGGLAGCLIAYGAAPTQAAAAVVVYHAIAFWIPSLGGLAGFALLRRRLGATHEAHRTRYVGYPVPAVTTAFTSN